LHLHYGRSQNEHQENSQGANWISKIGKALTYLPTWAIRRPRMPASAFETSGPFYAVMIFLDPFMILGHRTALNGRKEKKGKERKRKKDYPINIGLTVLLISEWLLPS
jgi:hypothetical protein